MFFKYKSVSILLDIHIVSSTCVCLQICLSKDFNLAVELIDIFQVSTESWYSYWWVKPKVWSWTTMKRHDVICYHSLNKALTNLISFRLFPALIATAESICYISYFQLTLSSSFFFHIIFPFIEIVDPREIWRFLNWQALRNHLRAERRWNCRALGKVLFAARGLTLRSVSTPYSTTWNWSNFLSFSFGFSLRQHILLRGSYKDLVI